MSKKAAVPLKIAPLQGVIAQLITDPAERAALDAARKRLKRVRGGQKVKKSRDAAGLDASPAAKEAEKNAKG